MKTPLAILAFGCLIGLGGCAEQSKAVPIAALSTTDRASNSAKIAQLIEQQCFDRSEDAAAFDAGLQATGWGFTRHQKANDAKPEELDAWDVPTMIVLRGQPVKGSLSTCLVIAKGPISPLLGQVKAAISTAVGHQPGADGEWWWKPDAAHRSHMTVENGTVEDGVPGESIFIKVEFYRLSLWQRILGQ